MPSNPIRKIHATRPLALIPRALRALGAFGALGVPAAIATLAAAPQPSQGAPPVRYKDDLFTTVVRTPDIKYGSSLSYTGATENLLLDFYQPGGDTAKARPLFIWVHGGGFSGGAKTDGDMLALCNAFARKGYAAASIAYRLEPADRINTAPAMSVAAYRAVQDAKAAVRFLRAHKADYRIDVTRILLGGTSAGGVVSLLYAYLDQAEVPDDVDADVLGGLEGSGGTPGVSSAINGIVNCWGGVGDSTWLNNGMLPALSFHGTEDPTVPYDKGYSLGNPALKTFGSDCAHRVLTRAGVKNVLKPFVGMGHGVPGGDPRADTLVAMTRDFAYELLFGGGTSLGKVPKNPGSSPNITLPMQRWGIRADGRALDGSVSGPNRAQAR